MTFGLRCSQPACRPHPASLPVRVPTVESLLSASFSFASRLRLAVRYSCRHRLRLAPFIQRDSAHAGHTGADPLVRGRRPRRPWSAARTVILISEERVQGDPRGTGGPPHDLYSIPNV